MKHYKCYSCGSSKKDLTSFVNHCYLHRWDHNYTYRCPVVGCVVSYKMHASFRAHVHYKHIDIKFKSNKYDISSSTCTLEHCQQKCSNLNNLINHFKSHFEFGLKVKCPFNNCRSSFGNVPVLRTHISRNHKILKPSSITDLEEYTADSDLNSSFVENEEDITIQSHEESLLNAPNNIPQVEEDIPAMFEKNLGTFYSKLYSKCLVASETIQEIVNAIDNLAEININYMINKARISLENIGLETHKIEVFLSNMKHSNLFKKNSEFKSSHLRQNFLKNRLGHVQPIEVILGKKNNKDHKAYYVPLLQSLANLINNNTKVIDVKKKEKNENYSDITDGKLYLSNKVFQLDESIAIVLYMDAFEPLNPLGPAKGLYKMMGVYYSLVNIDNFRRSSVDQMQLLMMCTEKDLKYFGYHVVFEPFLKEIAILESQGITLDGQCEKVKGTLHSIVSDNLGAHGIAGMIESFSGHYFCRYCLVTKSEFVEDPCCEKTLRSIDHYNVLLPDIDELGIGDSVLGVKKRSVFVTEEYHVFAPGLPPCLGHDLFEGVVAYDLHLIIVYFIKQDWFELEFMNYRIKNFGYGATEKKDKPPLLSITKTRLAGNAVQNWVLLRMLPLLIGKHVKPEDDIWQLYIKLKSLVELIVAPKITGVQICILLQCISEYLYERKKLFPDVSLRPKHHYLLHYPWLIDQFGPLIYVWTMRFESKHRFFKRTAKACNNYKNLQKSLSERHQYLQAYFNSGTLFDQILSCQDLPANVDLNGSEYAISMSVMEYTAGDTLSEDITYKGIRYRKNDCVLTSFDSDNSELVVGKIRTFLIKSDKVVMCLTAHLTQYHRNLGLFELISKDTRIVTKEILNLLDHQVLTEYFEDGRSFVTLKHSFPFNFSY